MSAMYRRLLCALLALLLVCGAAAAEDAALRGWNKTDKYQYVLFGAYPQTAEGGVEPVLWRVLRADGEQALLLAEYVLDAEPIIRCDDKKMQEKHTYRRITAFEESDLYPWLSEVMAPTLFTGAQLAALDDTRGKVFILNDKEFTNVDYGFTRTIYGEGDVPALRCRKTTPTPYAKQKGDIYTQSGGCTYWVDNVKGKLDYKMGIVGFNGHMSYGAYHRTNIGIRPAILVNMALVELAEGDGTMENPYQLLSLCLDVTDEGAAEDEMLLMTQWYDAD